MHWFAFPLPPCSWGAGGAAVWRRDGGSVAERELWLQPRLWPAVKHSLVEQSSDLFFSHRCSPHTCSTPCPVCILLSNLWFRERLAICLHDDRLPRTCQIFLTGVTSSNLLPTKWVLRLWSLYSRSYLFYSRTVFKLCRVRSCLYSAGSQDDSGGKVGR